MIQNRPIKFRAWDRENKVMVQGFCKFAIDSFDARCFDYRHQKFEQPYDLMQFTGLYDKNKKPIYEGDIVRTSLGNAKCEILPTGTWFGGMDIQLSGYPNIEVIGNIYENPKML